MDFNELIQTDPEQAKEVVRASLRSKVFDYLDSYKLDEGFGADRGFRGVNGARHRENDEGHGKNSGPGELEPIGKYKHPVTGKLTDKFRNTKTGETKWLGDK